MAADLDTKGPPVIAQVKSKEGSKEGLCVYFLFNSKYTFIFYTLKFDSFLVLDGETCEFLLTISIAY